MYSLITGYARINSDETNGVLMTKEQQDEMQMQRFQKTMVHPIKKHLALVGVTIEETYILGRKNPDIFTCTMVKNKILSVFQNIYGDECVVVGKSQTNQFTDRYLIAVPKERVGFIITEEEKHHVLLTGMNALYDKYLKSGFVITPPTLLQLMAPDVMINYMRNHICTCPLIEGRILTTRGFSSLQISLIQNEDDALLFSDKSKDPNRTLKSASINKENDRFY